MTAVQPPYAGEPPRPERGLSREEYAATRAKFTKTQTT
jgi:hypothetical protein